MKTVIFGLVITLLFLGGITYYSYNKDCLLGMDFCHDMEWRDGRRAMIPTLAGCGGGFLLPQNKDYVVENKIRYIDYFEITYEDIEERFVECDVPGTDRYSDEEFLARYNMTRSEYKSKLDAYRRDLKKTLAP